MRNSVKVKIGDREVELLASLSNVKAVEKAMGETMGSIYDKISKSEVTVERMEQFLIKASYGNTNNVLTAEDIAAAFDEGGIIALTTPALQFTAIAFRGCNIEDIEETEGKS